MANRIFVNTQNEKYRKVISNAKGPYQGLGTVTELTDAERSEFQQLATEIYFSGDDLREKKRKIQIIFDSFTDPKFFGDGSVDPDVVLTEMRLLGQSTLTSITEKIKAASVTAPNRSGGRDGFLKAKREDNDASWQMTRADFPNITAQAIKNSPTRRSIQRLYDDVGGVRTFDVSTEEAIALLIRESLADALFCTTNPSGIATTPPDHPGPGGNGNADASGTRWVNKDALRRHFPFAQETTGENKIERTYAKALIYLKNYIDLIDDILNLQQQSLSRTPDTVAAIINVPIRISLSTATVQLFRALANTAREVIREKTLTFFDENREYKTLLNFGDDNQYVIEAWRLAPNNTGSLQLKLFTPLDSNVRLQNTAFISRELAESVVDTIDFELSPAADTTPYLRPFNMGSRNYVDSQILSANSTLKSLGLTTGSEGAVVNNSISYNDTVFRRWFTADYKSSELNIDFTNYNNFIHFGSAYKRLQSFTQKLRKVEELAASSASYSVSSSTIVVRNNQIEKERLLRTFDLYEQFLYYATGSIPYTASAFYAPNEVEYNTTAYWPKQADNTPYSPDSVQATNWLNVQSVIAQRYDDNNPNYLVTNLPTYIREDANSEDFTTFVSMVGHVFDNIKVYADQFSNIYATSIDPLKDLTMDQVYEVAQSFGLQLPNVYALENLQTLNAQFTGETGSRAYAAETWKRFLHSLIYFAKTKGSRTSLDALLNTYGINSPVLQIKETTYPTAGNYIRSDELTYGLEFTGSVASFITVPLVSSSLSGSTIQLSFNPILRQSSSLITANGWALDLIPHPSESKIEYGRIDIVSGSTRSVIATSSYFPLFSEDYTSLMLRSESNDVSIIQTDGDQILFQQSASVSWGSLWNNSTVVYIGGSGSIKLASNFDGIVDEIRVWGENISNEDFVAQAYDPGSYYASTYTSSYEDLYVHIPFSQPLTSITASVLNESPYKNVAIVQTLPAQGFTTESYTRILRSIKQFVPIVGSSVYTNRKVTIAPPPVFNEQFVDGDGTRRLSRIESIKRVEEKTYTSGQNIVSFAISPTDFINQNIIRSMGVVEVNNLIGSPRYITGSGYTSLQRIEKDYLKYFNKTINPNEYIRFFKDLVEGPAEAAQTMVPARTKLIDGIVIESPVISRHKDYTIRTFAVDGSGTKKFNRFVAGSGSVGIGAYDFNELIEKVKLLPDVDSDTLPITATIAITGSVMPKSSTQSSKLPSFRKVTQKIGDDFVTSSILDDNSSYNTLEATPINGAPRTDVISTGYPRDAFVGIPATGSIPQRLASENNTLIPFYDIPPRADFSDIGTTTYFHKSNGIYSYDIYTLYKQEYLVKFDTKVDTPLGRLSAPLTLLPPSTPPGETGRDDAIIAAATYSAGSRSFGVIKIANIFSLYAIDGAAGLRIRLYRTAADRTADEDRDFLAYPSIDSGVLFDGMLEGLRTVFPYVMMQTTESTIYYTIDNEIGTTILSPITLYYFAYDPDSLIPIGYLPRHYKYSRDNRIALKRRNYLGCRNINISPDDGASAYSVSLSQGNTVVVNPGPTEANNKRFGGAGRLNVE